MRVGTPTLPKLNRIGVLFHKKGCSTMSLLREFFQSIVAEKQIPLAPDPFDPSMDRLPGPSALRLVTKELWVLVGGKQQINAALVHSHGDVRDLTKEVEWSSSAQDVLSIDKNGLAAASAAPGTAKVTAAHMDSGLSASVEVAVITNGQPRPEPVWQSITITPDNPTIKGGWRQEFKAMALLSNGHSRDVTDEVVWFTRDYDIIAFDDLDRERGAAVAKRKTGTTQICARNKDSTVRGSTKATVTWDPANPQMPPAQKVDFTIETELPFGAVFQCSAVGFYADGSRHDVNSEVDWSSSEPGILSIDSNGEMITRASGTARITAVHKATGFKKSADITIYTAPVCQSIRILDRDLVVRGHLFEVATKLFFPDYRGVGLCAMGKFPDGTELLMSFDECSWSSSAPDVLEIANNRAYPCAKGTATITAVHKALGLSASITLKVRKDPLEPE